MGGEDTENASPFERTSGAALEAAGPKEPTGWMGRQAWGVEVSGGLNSRSRGGPRGSPRGRGPEAGELARDGAPKARQGVEGLLHPFAACRQEGEHRREDRAHRLQRPPWGPTSPHCLSPLNLAQRRPRLRPQAESPTAPPQQKVVMGPSSLKSLACLSRPGKLAGVTACGWGLSLYSRQMLPLELGSPGALSGPRKGLSFGKSSEGLSACDLGRSQPL